MPSRAIACIDSGVGRVDAAHRLLDRLAVDGDAGRVRLDGGEHVPAQPRDVLEEPLVGGLAQGDVEADLVLGELQALAVRRRCWPGSARRCRPGRAAGRCRRRRAPRRRAEPSAWPSWPPKSAPPSVATIDCIGPSWARVSVGDQVAHRADHAAGDRVAELAPDVERVVEPLVAAPRGGGRGCRTGSADAGSSHRSARRSASSTACRSYDGHRRVAGGGELAGGHLAGQVPVDRAAAGRGEHVLQLRHELLHLRGIVGVGRLRRPGSAKPNGISGTTSTVRAPRPVPLLALRSGRSPRHCRAQVGTLAA